MPRLQLYGNILLLNSLSILADWSIVITNDSIQYSFNNISWWYMDPCFLQKKRWRFRILRKKQGSVFQTKLIECLLLRNLWNHVVMENLTLQMPGSFIFWTVPAHWQQHVVVCHISLQAARGRHKKKLSLYYDSILFKKRGSTSLWEKWRLQLV